MRSLVPVSYTHLAKRLFMVICMLIVISCTLLLGSAFASAHDSGEKDTNNKYYKCIEVAPGETLWTVSYTHLDVYKRQSGYLLCRLADYD